MDAAHELKQALAYTGGTADKVRAVLAKGIDPNTPMRDADSALCLATMFGQTESVKVLLEAGANVNHVGMLERTPLMSAKSAEVARMLIEHGADLGARDRLGYDALHEVIVRVDDVDHARVLLDGGLVIHRYFEAARKVVGRPIPSHLGWAANCGRPGIIALLLERGGHVDETEADETPVVFSPLNKDPPRGHDIVRLLLEAGANPEAVDRWGGSLLQRISRRRDAALLAVVLRCGADVTRPPAGILPASLLENAAGEGDVEVITVLLENDAGHVDTPNDRGETPLMIAARQGRIDAVELLLRCGADPHKRDNSGTAVVLHVAASGQLALYDRLIASGCDAAAVDDGGWTAFEYACTSGNAAFVTTLLDRGADIDRLVGDKRVTPLMLVTSSGQDHIASLLLQRGANASTRNADGKTAADLAAERAIEVAEEWARYRGD